MPDRHDLPALPMATTTTLGPLHFEDLEPKRFEDLARQLIYDFKPWRKLEATGRAGSDDGFDARGYEMVQGLAEPVAPEGDRVSADASDDDTSEARLEEFIEEGQADRLWLVQCKRERTIGPTKLLAYLDDIVLVEGELLHGLVLAAACDFSKRARDAFASKCREMGIQEWHLWGKAELEDRLFQPRNDSLLFAYFGISLSIRRRSQRTELRARLTMKRKAARLLRNHAHQQLLIRPPLTPTYPYHPSGPDAKTGELPWFMREFRKLDHQGLVFCTRRFFAYLHEDGKQWDAAMAFNEVRAARHENPWREGNDDLPLAAKAREAWLALPEANRAYVEVHAVIAFEDLLDIDEIGDDWVEQPHIYAAFDPAQNGPFKVFYMKVEPVWGRAQPDLYLAKDEDGRIEVFPSELRQELARR